jgi:hypothetical protein
MAVTALAKSAHDNSQVSDIRRCREFGEYLTAWEAEFINSIAASIREWGRLTQKQASVLERIVNKLKGAGLWSGESWQ